MKAAYEIVKARFTSDPDLPDDKLRFPMLVLSEPPKQTVLAWKSGDTFPRVAYVEVLHNESNRTWVALVDLRQSKLISLEQMLEGTQPALTDSESKQADAIIRAYKPWQEAMRARGVNPDLAYLDYWAPGDAPIPDEVAALLPHGQNTRLLRYLTFDISTTAQRLCSRCTTTPMSRRHFALTRNRSRPISAAENSLDVVCDQL